MSGHPHTCSTTGLRLVPFGDLVGYHVGKAAYAQPSAAIRTAGIHRQDWGRFDVLGQTYYVAENREIAYAEVLATFKLPNGAAHPLQDEYPVELSDPALQLAADRFRITIT